MTIGTVDGNSIGDWININKARPITQQQIQSNVPEDGIPPVFIKFPPINDDNKQDDNITNPPGGVAIKFILDYIINNIKNI